MELRSNNCRQNPLGNRPILKHVGHTRGNPEVVFQHVDSTVGVAHQVRPANMRPDAMARLGAHALLQKLGELLMISAGTTLSFRIFCLL